MPLDVLSVLSTCKGIQTSSELDVEANSGGVDELGIIEANVVDVDVEVSAEVDAEDVDMLMLGEVVAIDVQVIEVHASTMDDEVFAEILMFPLLVDVLQDVDDVVNRVADEIDVDLDAEDVVGVVLVLMGIPVLTDNEVALVEDMVAVSHTLSTALLSM
eukprot:4748193-Amphidinium_carterae.1